MPPYALWLRGPASVRGWLLGPGAECRGSWLVATAACGSPAFAQYRAAADGGHRAWALVVLEQLNPYLNLMTKKFDALAVGGKVTYSLHDAFWGAKFGMLTDAFGIGWLFSCEQKRA